MLQTHDTQDLNTRTDPGTESKNIKYMKTRYTRPRFMDVHKYPFIKVYKYPFIKDQCYHKMSG